MCKLVTEADNGIAGHKRVGTGRKLVYLVGLGVCVKIVKRTRGAAKMSARGKAEGGNLFISHAANKAHSSLYVGQGSKFITGVNIVVKDEGVDAVLVKHYGNRLTLVVRLHTVSAARTNDYRGLIIVYLT